MVVPVLRGHMELEQGRRLASIPEKAEVMKLQVVVGSGTPTIRVPSAGMVINGI